MSLRPRNFTAITTGISAPISKDPPVTNSLKQPFSWVDPKDRVVIRWVLNHFSLKWANEFKTMQEFMIDLQKRPLGTQQKLSERAYNTRLKETSRANDELKGLKPIQFKLTNDSINYIKHGCKTLKQKPREFIETLIRNHSQISMQEKAILTKLRAENKILVDRVRLLEEVIEKKSSPSTSSDIQPENPIYLTPSTTVKSLDEQQHSPTVIYDTVITRTRAKRKNVILRVAGSEPININRPAYTSAIEMRPRIIHSNSDEGGE